MCGRDGCLGGGKTAVARRLAERLDLPWIDADDLHPVRTSPRWLVARRSTTPTGNRGWRRSAHGCASVCSAGPGGVVACSALARSHRDVLRRSVIGVVFVHLTAEPAVIAHRIAPRTGHFMPASLLASQLRRSNRSVPVKSVLPSMPGWTSTRSSPRQWRSCSGRLALELLHRQVRLDLRDRGLLHQLGSQEYLERVEVGDGDADEVVGEPDHAAELHDLVERADL
ncbi:hypothetical protein GS425_18490 [Rhodococcus hoagii]|nr:hypothetical protein [Prescottella equi]